jgi:hypothetical protein
LVVAAIRSQAAASFFIRTSASPPRIHADLRGSLIYPCGGQ